MDLAVVPPNHGVLTGSVLADDALCLARPPDCDVHVPPADLDRRRAGQVGGVERVELLPTQPPAQVPELGTRRVTATRFS